MNTTRTIAIQSMPAPAMPRGALWFGLLVDAVLRLRDALTPPPARPRTAFEQAVAEAAQVRALAQSVRASQPGFAADLIAAADRHERLAEEAARR